MDMRSAVAASNIGVLSPRRCHGAFHPQMTSCGLLFLPRRPLQSVTMAGKKQSLLPNVVRATSSRDYESGSEGGKSIVDASMPLLRERINMVKLQESKIQRPRPEEGLESEWLEWEKRLYPTYHSKVCETMGLLHNYLIYTRPSVAFASLSAMAVVVGASVVHVLVTSVSSIHLAQFGT